MVEALIWALALVWIVERGIRPYADRLLRLWEGKLQPPPAKIELPLDLARHVAAQSETWAKDDLERFIHEEYAEHRDWNVVRQKVGLSPAHDSTSPVH